MVQLYGVITESLLDPELVRRFPLYAVGYTGWKAFETVKRQVKPENGINGVLVTRLWPFSPQPGSRKKAARLGPICRGIGGLVISWCLPLHQTSPNYWTVPPRPCLIYRESIPEWPKSSIIKHGHFVGRYEFLDHKNKPQPFEYEAKNTSMALWGLITCIHHAGSMVTSATKNVPKRYDP